MLAQSGVQAPPVPLSEGMGRGNNRPAPQIVRATRSGMEVYGGRLFGPRVSLWLQNGALGGLWAIWLLVYDHIVPLDLFIHIKTPPDGLSESTGRGRWSLAVGICRCGSWDFEIQTGTWEGRSSFA